MEKVIIGIIGIGNMGSAHARSIIAGHIPEMELVAVADRKESRREWARASLPDTVRIYDSGEELIETESGRSGGCNAVIVAVPHYQHPDLVIRALRSDMHAVSEKPAGVYTRQVRAMNEEADRHPELIFAMMFNQRTNCVYRKMKELVESGAYGQIKRVNWIITDWYRTQAYYDSGDWRATWEGEGGGVLLNQCPHNLDLLQWICGLPVKVQAFTHEGKWHHIEVEDDVTAYLEFENGATGVFITSTGDAPGTNRFEIDMECAKLVCEHDKLTAFELDDNERHFCFAADEGFGQPVGHEVEIATDGKNEQHDGVLRAFADAVLHGGKLVADGREGIRGLTLSNAMHLSSWLGHPVSLKPFDEDRFLEELNKKRAASKQKENVVEKTFNTEGTYGGGK